MYSFTPLDPPLRGRGLTSALCINPPTTELLRATCSYQLSASCAQTPEDMAAAIGGGAAAELEKEYIRMDFLSWDVTFALRNHQPSENRHRRSLSPGQAKKEVLYSPRLQRIIAEVSGGGRRL